MEAVKNKTFEHIKSDALRRFRLTNGDSKKDEIERKGKDGKHVFGWWRDKNGTLIKINLLNWKTSLN